MSYQDLKKKIIDMQNDSIYQNLSASYNKQNIFSILKIERMRTDIALSCVGFSILTQSMVWVLFL